jgi:hypothetical protein
MGLFTTRKKSEIQKAWSLKTKDGDTVVWKLLISPNGVLVGEERNLRDRTSSLFALEVETGTVRWRGVGLNEAWWFGTERATEDTLYIQTFRKPDMPDPKGIIALDLASGKERWSNPDLIMLFDKGDELYAAREMFGMKEFIVLDSATGEIKESLGRDEETVRHIRLTLTEDDIHSLYSTPLDEQSELFQPVEALLKSTIGVKDIRGTIDYAEYGKHLIFSYHERGKASAQAMLDNMLTNELHVLDKDKGEIVYSDTLNKETPFPVPDNFFINRGTLIYVKEKRELLGIRLD